MKATKIVAAVRDGDAAGSADAHEGVYDPLGNPYTRILRTPGYSSVTAVPVDASLAAAWADAYASAFADGADARMATQATA